MTEGTHTTRGQPVVFLLLGVGFPWGMASSSRVRMLARCLTDSGRPARVLCLLPSENSEHVENTRVRGTFLDTPFEYTCLTTVRSSHLLFAVFRAVVGLCVAAVRLGQWKRRGEIACAYLYSCPQEWTFRYWCAKSLLRLLRVPIAVDLCERPWPLRPQPRFIERVVSPLSGVAGVVAISEYLYSWALDEAARRSQTLRVTRIPILVDSNEWSGLPERAERPTVLLSIMGYGPTVRFLVDAMQTVWEEVPDCRLVVTGADPARITAGATSSQQATLRDSRISLAGYLPRRALMNEYGRAWVFAVPLFADTRSVARFPTKLGEYLSCRRPVVATRVGEMIEYLTHEVDAFLANPGDAQDFGRLLSRAILNQEEARQLAERGYELACNRFHYAVNSGLLVDLIDSMQERHVPNNRSGSMSFVMYEPPN